MAFLNDTLTGATGTALTAHTGETGAIWTRHTSYGADSILTDANRCRPNGTCLNYASGLPSGAEYDITAILRPFSIVSGNNIWIAARVDTAADTQYFAGYNSTNTRWEIFSRVAGTNTQLAVAAATLTTGIDYTIALLVRNATKTLLVNGAQVCQTNDNTISAAGRVGIRGAGATNNTTGIHMDSITAVDAGNSPQRGVLLNVGGEPAFKPVWLAKSGVLT